mgnify:CR=1 FL=1
MPIPQLAFEHLADGAARQLGQLADRRQALRLAHLLVDPLAHRLGLVGGAQPAHERRPPLNTLSVQALAQTSRRGPLTNNTTQIVSFANVFSIGDVIILIGVAYFVHRACRPTANADGTTATPEPAPAFQ